MAVSFSADGTVGTIVLDKPPANSYDMAYMEEFGAAIDAADASDARVVVVRSASEKFFCAGADIKAFIANDADFNTGMIRTGHGVLASMATSPKLFVAWIAGHALGGGLEISLACDIRYALDGTFKLGTPEVRLGILPGNGGTQRLPRLIGLGPALELLTTGRQIGPQEAHGLGLVSQLFPDAAAFDDWIAQLATLPPLALRNIKRAAFGGYDMTLEDGLDHEVELIDELFRTHDADEGLRAFGEKRRADFTGT